MIIVVNFSYMIENLQGKYVLIQQEAVVFLKPRQCRKFNLCRDVPISLNFI